MTSICDVLSTARVPAVLVGLDRTVRFVSADARVLLGFPPNVQLPTLSDIEQRLGTRVADLKRPSSVTLKLGQANVHFSVVPLAGGASGTVLILRPQEGTPGHASFISYVREAVLTPLRGLKETLAAASSNRPSDPLLEDATSTIEQILSSIELAPDVEEASESGAPARAPNVTSIVRRVGDRFTTVAERKRVSLQIDANDIADTFSDHHELESVLVILMENSLHYVPAGGQIVLGVRSLEHKGRPLILFFIMDNGPLVPEEMREAIFTPEFAWHPSSPQRGGRGLARCRDFAAAHGGSIWVESKTGKACTFFLRVRPDEAK
jgi:signal transduction histidine kinase